MREVREHLFNSNYKIPVNVVVQSTPSSMHSLFVLAPYLRQSPFCLATVDTIFYEREFQQYLDYAQSQAGSDGVLAVTDFIDDEKPLCVELDENRRILRFSDAKEQLRYATGGIYYFSPRIFDVMDEVLATGYSCGFVIFSVISSTMDIRFAHFLSPKLSMSTTHPIFVSPNSFLRRKNSDETVRTFFLSFRNIHRRLALSFEVYCRQVATS